MTKENKEDQIGNDHAITPGEHQYRFPDLLENCFARRESAVAKDEEVVVNREKLVALREQLAYLREGKADAREGEIRAAQAMLAQTYDHMVKLQQANANLVVATIESHKKTEQVETAKSELYHLAHHDVLTDLPNRMLLRDRLNQAIQLARRRGGKLAVMFLDLDRFKLINDSMGHAAGDHVLKSVAERLVSCIRQSDTVSRHGGDEFIILLSSIEHAEDATLSAEKMFTALSLPHVIDQNTLHIGASMGISIFPGDGEDAESLIQSADTAMYFAKENGRNAFKQFEIGMNAQVIQRQSIEKDLFLAIEHQQFLLHYQPKVNLRSGRIVGVEALIRWQHPNQGLLHPLQFIPVAEGCGLILQIGQWAMRQACHQGQAWAEASLAPLTIAVNTSAMELRSQGFVETVRTILTDTNLAHHLLELEITEDALKDDDDTTGSAMHALAAMGVMLTIDNFGTGYSNLESLSRLPIHTLKIDHTLVGNTIGSPTDSTVVSAAIGVGRSLKKRVIAEGVETSQQQALLLSLECDEGQGRYFGNPVTAEAMTSLLKSDVQQPM